MIRILAILPLLFLPNAVLGKTFECSDAIAAAFSEITDEKAPVLVVTTVNAGGRTGTIEVADRKFEAEYQVEGLDRTWRFFTGKGQKYGYLFLIRPDGSAAYFDHETSEGEPTYPDQVYLCFERETEVSAPEITQVESLQPLDQTGLGAYKFAIAQKISRNWARPPTAAAGLECIVNIRQLPGGEVVSVSLGSCNGDETVRRSIEAAVFKASPLPAPSDPSLFDRNLRLEFRPAD